MWFKFWLNFWCPSVSGCSLLSYFKWLSFSPYPSPLSFEQHKQCWLSREGRGALSIHYLLIEMVKKVNSLTFKMIRLIHMQQPHCKKGSLLGSRVSWICIKEGPGPYDDCYPMKNLILPILHYCLGVIIDQGRAIKTKTLCNSETKTFIQFLSHNIFRAGIKNKTISHLAGAAFAIVPSIIQKP